MFMDRIAAMFNEHFGEKPSLADAEMYCMDDESSGCTVEMLEVLAEAKSAKPAAETKPIWSSEIDDAVFKTD